MGKSTLFAEKNSLIFFLIPNHEIFPKFNAKSKECYFLCDEIIINANGRE